MGTAKKQAITSRRCRTGCWTCKERRVKCNEERPACSTCMRLGLSCYYGIKLLWREDAASRGIALGRSGRWSKRPRISNDNPQDQYDMKAGNRSSVPSSSLAEAVYRMGHDWMFLNTTYGDFQPQVNENEISGVDLSSIYSQFSSIADDFSPSYSSRWDMTLDAGSLFDTPALENDYFGDPAMDFLDDSFLGSLDPYDDGIEEPFWSADTAPSFSLMSHTISPFRIGENEMYLLNYFMSSLSPRCTPWPAENPFNAIIIPICLSAPTKPLFYTVMAAASHQLSLLRDNRFEKDIWIYRAKALRGFQEDISHFNDQHGPPVGWEQIISTLIMLAFFDISQTGSSTWTVHLRCAQSLQDLLPLSSQMSAEQISIRRFFCTYFIEHEALARTGSNMPNLNQNRATWLHPELGLNMKVIDSFLGCSHELISLISMISDLAEEQDSLERNPNDEVFDKGSLKEKLQSLRVRRNNIERSLQTLQQEIPTVSAEVFDYGEESSNDTEELRLIAETRRLSALIYLYYRLDNIRPTDPRIARFTRQILDMIPKISLRSHALLWQLFVVGTMGLGFPDADTGDADRILVLERLRSLQNTRQLRNVRRARKVVEAVWKARDLGGPEAEDGGWDEVVGVRGQGVSLC